MKVSLIAAISANGKIAEVEDQKSLDWTSKEDLAFFIQKTKELGVVIMGRKTYNTIGKPLKGRLNIVVTRSLEGKESIPDLLEFTDKAPGEILKDLSSRGYETAALTGGSAIYGLFLEEGLVDELFLTVEPVLFGKGVSLAENFDRVNLELVSSVSVGEQAVLIHYSVKK